MAGEAAAAQTPPTSVIFAGGRGEGGSKATPLVMGIVILVIIMLIVFGFSRISEAGVEKSEERTTRASDRQDSRQTKKNTRSCKRTCDCEKSILGFDIICLQRDSDCVTSCNSSGGESTKSRKTKR